MDLGYKGLLLHTRENLVTFHSVVSGFCLSINMACVVFSFFPFFLRVFTVLTLSKYCFPTTSPRLDSLKFCAKFVIRPRSEIPKAYFAELASYQGKKGPPSITKW